MYKSLEAKVLADEARKKEAERDRRVSMGLPAEEQKGMFKRMLKKVGAKKSADHGAALIA